MPCYDGREQSDLNEAIKRANDNARVACFAISLLEKMGVDIESHIEIRAWWKEHKDFDIARGAK